VSARPIRAAVESFYADVWNRHDRSAIPALLRPDVTFRGSLGAVRSGHAAFAAYVDEVHAALGDYRCDVLDLVCEDRRAFARMRFSGVHRGPFLGFAPTGERVAWSGAALFTADADGLLADVWVLGDLQALHEQLRANAAR